MKASLKFWTVLFFTAFVLGGCCDDSITPENPDTGNDNPPVEQPEEPIEKPLTDGSLFTVQLNDDIMATVGTGTWNAIAMAPKTPSNEYYAVNSKGECAYSRSGSSWALQTVDSSQEGWNLNDIAFGGGYFVAVGRNGAPYRCAGLGTGWLKGTVNGGSGAYWKCIAYGEGLFVVAGGSSRGLLYSKDGYGSVWTFVSTYDSQNFGSMAYGNGIFVATGYINKKIYWENKDNIEDGSAWNEGFSGGSSDYPFKKVVYGNGKFVTLGKNSSSGRKRIMTSVDAQSWDKFYLPQEAENLCFGNGYFLAFGSNGIVMISEDAENWTEINSDIQGTVTCACVM